MPKDGLARGVPWEDSERVGEKEPLGTQVSPNREDALFGMIDGRKHELVGKLIDGHALPQNHRFALNLLHWLSGLP